MRIVQSHTWVARQQCAFSTSAISCGHNCQRSTFGKVHDELGNFFFFLGGGLHQSNALNPMPVSSPPGLIWKIAHLILSGSNHAYEVLAKQTLKQTKKSKEKNTFHVQTRSRHATWIWDRKVLFTLKEVQLKLKRKALKACTQHTVAAYSMHHKRCSSNFLLLLAAAESSATATQKDKPGGSGFWMSPWCDCSLLLGSRKSSQ